MEIVSYQEFKLVIEEFGRYIMGKIQPAKFIITDDLPNKVLGRCKNNEYIKINTKVIKEMYNGNKLIMYVIFHEFKHFIDNYNIKNNILDLETIEVLKEELIMSYIEESSKNLGIYTREDANYYYEDNYVNETSEVLANIYAYEQMLVYYKKIGLQLSKNELENIELKIKHQVTKLSKKRRCLQRVSIFNSFYLDIDEIFTYAIREHPDWLERYPFFKEDYFTDKENKVNKRKEKLVSSSR